MSTPLLQQFPSLTTYPPSFLKDLLSSPALTEAFLFTLPEVQALVAQVEQLGKENDEIASQSPLPFSSLLCLLKGDLYIWLDDADLSLNRNEDEAEADNLGRNLELRDELLALRENTAQAYGHAEAMKVQWQEIEKAQNQLYSVSFSIFT